ncbi:DMT family transporter [Nostocoides sp. HKS02]|uniref:DMT family transporter n=1 Tax=Nostocoides sp. HKS02 TaxID=1813880 RepID=UPI0012B4CAD6|nr:DMT family transporter [Tetrasphaera sp. HKS02]QGN58558.1 hypothetical protein GKE56_12425 [Tetrasphaera sp. HKS02]
MTNLPVVGASLGATLFFALSTALKHRSATTLAPSRGTEGAARLAHFFVATLSHRWWIAGLIADAGGLGLQAFALHIGEVSVVQPLLVTALLFSLILSHRVSGTRMTPAELRWGGVLVAALVGFLVISGAATNHSPTRRRTGGRRSGRASVPRQWRRSAWPSPAVYRTDNVRHSSASPSAPSTPARPCSSRRSRTSPPTMDSSTRLFSWQLPVLIVAGAGGILLAQVAFRSGPLTASLPAMASLDPLLSVALGIIVYDEHLRGGTGPVAGEILSLAALAAAAIALSRIPAAQDGSALPEL